MTMKGYVLIHLIEFLESKLSSDQLAQLKKSKDRRFQLFQEALVYSNDYPVELLNEYLEAASMLRLLSDSFLQECGKFLGIHTADQYFYIYRNAGILSMLQSIRNLYPYIFGLGEFSFSMQKPANEKTIISLELEINGEEPIPDQFWAILKECFHSMMKFADEKIRLSARMEKNQNRQVFHYESQ